MSTASIENQYGGFPADRDKSRISPALRRVAGLLIIGVLLAEVPKDCWGNPLPPNGPNNIQAGQKYGRVDRAVGQGQNPPPPTQNQNNPFFNVGMPLGVSVRQLEDEPREPEHDDITATILEFPHLEFRTAHEPVEF